MDSDGKSEIVKCKDCLFNIKVATKVDACNNEKSWAREALKTANFVMVDDEKFTCGQFIHKDLITSSDTLKKRFEVAALGSGDVMLWKKKL